MPASLGSFIRERRLALGLTQEQLAERMGETVRQAEISRIETDRIALPRRERMEHLAAALEVSLGELLVRSGWMAEGDLVPDAPSAALPWDVLLPEEVDSLAFHDLVAMLERIGEAQDQVIVAGAVLEDARKTVLAELRSQAQDASHPQNKSDPQAGILNGAEIGL